MHDTYFDLGSYSFPITTAHADAQVWFDRGLNWSYAFNREEARRCFDEVVRLDPDCAMGHWGQAYAAGPYYNVPWWKVPLSRRGDVVAFTHERSQRALALAEAGAATEVEVGLCRALTARFQNPDSVDLEVLDTWDDGYADAMREVQARFPEHDDVTALTVEALMVRTPWALWDLEAARPADGADTAEAIELVEQAFALRDREGRPDHPGLLHFYIHIMEMSPEPERALDASRRLETLVPDAGHLLHMPTHIYVLCGDYQRTIDLNVEAVRADDAFIERNPALGLPTIYRLHNLHFQVYGALFSGQFEHALQAAEAMRVSVRTDDLLIDDPFLTNALEAFSGMTPHVLVRFGRWHDILDAPMPERPDLYSVSTAFWTYAKGIAAAVLGDVDAAARSQTALADAIEAVPEERVLFNNPARDILAIATSMLAGELDYRRGEYERAFAHLRHAVHLSDTLNYTEPWAWMQPPRHALGALLLEQGHVEEAAAVYRADLGLDSTLVRSSQHPNNVWSLHGYSACCERLGINEHEPVAAALADAADVADVEITASCFCATAEH